MRVVLVLTRDSIRSEARCRKGIEPASNSAGWGCACQCPGFFYLRSFRAQVVWEFCLGASIGQV